MQEIDLSQAIAEIKRKKAKLVLLQLPEGLKQQTTQLVEEIETKSGASCIASMDPCFGACDVPDLKAKMLQADLIVHLGHTKLLNANVETVFVAVERELSEQKIDKMAFALAERLKEQKISKIGLVATAQYLPALKALQEKLEENGIIALIQGNGQVLGCSYSNAHAIEKKAQAIVFFGDGKFHPLGIAFAVSKKVFALNPLEETIEDFSAEKEKFLRQRYGLISKVAEAKSFGILISTKKGQCRKEKALELKKIIEKNGKKAVLLAMDLFEPEYLLGIETEALVNTACPRIAIDDFARFPKPLLNPTELLIALGEKRLEEFKIDEMF